MKSTSQSKEYRREIRELIRDEKTYLLGLRKHIVRKVREVDDIVRHVKRSVKATDTRLTKSRRRRAILEGRLS